MGVLGGENVLVVTPADELGYVLPSNRTQKL